MILPKHAIESVMEISDICSEINKHNDEIAKLLSEHTLQYQEDFSKYMGVLLSTTAVRSEVSPVDSNSLIEFITGENTFSPDETYLCTIPPKLLYEVFLYQNMSKNVVLPQLIDNLKTMVLFVGQMGNVQKAETYFEEIISIYQGFLNSFKEEMN